MRSATKRTLRWLARATRAERNVDTIGEAGAPERSDGRDRSGGRDAPAQDRSANPGIVTAAIAGKRAKLKRVFPARTRRRHGCEGRAPCRSPPRGRTRAAVPSPRRRRA